MMDIRRRRAIVLTAAINPGVCPSVHLRDADERERQYYIALRRWVEWCGRNGGTVVFAEGSGADLSSFYAAFREKADSGALILYSSEESRSIVVRGKGNAEASLLTRVVSDVLIPGEFLSAVKCTGRLFVPNASHVLTPGVDDSLQVLIRSDLSHADSRFFCMPVTFLRDNLESLVEAIDEPGGHWFEHALARQVAAAVGRGVPFLPLRGLPRYRGESASTGARYDTVGAEIRRRIHQAARSALHRRGVFL